MWHCLLLSTMQLCDKNSNCLPANFITNNTLFLVRSVVLQLTDWTLQHVRPGLILSESAIGFCQKGIYKVLQCSNEVVWLDEAAFSDVNMLARIVATHKIGLCWLETWCIIEDQNQQSSRTKFSLFEFRLFLWKMMLIQGPISLKIWN